MRSEFHILAQVIKKIQFQKSFMEKASNGRREIRAQRFEVLIQQGSKARNIITCFNPTETFINKTFMLVLM